MPQKHNDSYTFLIDIIIAAFSSSVPKTLSAPIEFLKLRLTVMDQMLRQGILQRPYQGLIDCATRVAKQQGITTLWKGNFKNLVRFLPIQSLNFAFKDLFNISLAKSIQKDGPLIWVLSNLISGGLAGFVSVSCVYSLDVARMKQFNDLRRSKKVEPRQFNGLIDVYRKTLKSQGIKGLYRGFVILAIDTSIYRAIYFGLFDSIKQIVPSNIKNYLLTNLFLGWFTTYSAYLISSPIEQLRKRMMMQSEMTREYLSLIDFVRKIVANEGWKSLFKMQVKLYYVSRSFGGGITLSLYEKLQFMMFENRINLN